MRNIGTRPRQSFWDRYVGQSNDFGAPEESIVDQAYELIGKEMVIGGVAGALIGAGAGYTYGMDRLSTNEVTVDHVSEIVTTPKLVGADYDHSYTTSEIYYTIDSEGHMQHEYHDVYHPADWEPIVEELDTGNRRNYKKFVNSSFLNPVLGAAVGAGAGLVTGVALGALTRVLSNEDQRAGSPSYDSLGRYDRLEPKSRRELAADKAPLIGLGVGAVAGGLAGYHSGVATQAAGETLTQTIMEPVYKTELIGHIPHTSEFSGIPKDLLHTGDKLYYDGLPESYGSDPFRGSEQVRREVFQGRFEPVETTETSNFFTPTKGLLAGTFLGAGLGFGVGVASGVLMRMTESKKVPSATFS